MLSHLAKLSGFKFLITGLSIGLGLVLLRSSASHLANPYYFPGAVYDYDLVPYSTASYFAGIIPFVELVIAVSLLTGVMIRAGAATAVMMFTGFVVAQLVVMSRGQIVSCGCFGAAASQPVGWASVSIATCCLVASVVVLTLKKNNPLLRTGSQLRPGATLIEVLVVIAIMAVLFGLTAGAIQRVRAAAARTQCQNNLRQLAMSLHKYHDTEKHLPSGHNYYFLPGTKEWDPEAGLSWAARMLPYLDQTPLWKQVIEGWPGEAADAPSAIRVPVMLCPADRITSTPSGVFHNGKPWPISAAMSYVGVAGSGRLNRPAERDGVLFRSSAIRFADITDGTSSTLLLAERHGSNSRMTGVWGKARGLSGSSEYCHFLGTESTRDITDSRLCLNIPARFEPGRSDNECDLMHFWSSHAGGAHFAFCDGSVKFLRYEVDPLLSALATRAGGEVASFE